MGGNGEVRLGMRKSDGMKVAVKIVPIGRQTRESKSQIRALQCVNHVGIIQLIDWFESVEGGTGRVILFMIMELAYGGDFLDRLVRSSDRRLSEARAADAVKQMLEAMGHMHSRGLVHGDLKPENVLYLKDDDNSPVKITDFGFAQFLSSGQGNEGKIKSPPRGLTLGYVAPEILLGVEYDCKVDMWSLGVMLYVLLSGLKPFPRENPVPYITQCRWRFVEPHFTNVSLGARDLISKLLVLNPADRLSWKEALAHEWITGTAPDMPYDSANYEQLIRFNKERGAYCYSAHALAGLMSRLALPDAVAAMSSGKNDSLKSQRQEGSIQPLVTLAYSEDAVERQNACNAIANLALQAVLQETLVREGALRLLNKLAAQTTKNDVKFFVALSLAHLAQNQQLRVEMVRGGGEDAMEEAVQLSGAGGGEEASSASASGSGGYNTLDSLFGLAGLNRGLGAGQGAGIVGDYGGGELSAGTGMGGVGDWRTSRRAPQAASVGESAMSRAHEVSAERSTSNGSLSATSARGSDRVRQTAVQALALLAHEEELHQEMFLMDVGVFEAFVRQAHHINYKDAALGALSSICASSISLRGPGHIPLAALEHEIRSMVSRAEASRADAHVIYAKCPGADADMDLAHGLAAFHAQLEAYEMDRSWETVSPNFAGVLDIMASFTPSR